jgi:crotonobetainyl-CoA:carnitine CoA-transferase CaiB-like acyl-CoA transferase
MAAEPAIRPAALAGIRVIDLATPRAELAGRVLADLGADVIKVEPPGGSEARRVPPFDRRPGHEGESLYWAAVGLGKRSVVLDVERPEDRARLLAFIAGADVLLESFDPGFLDTLGLGYEALATLNPGLVYVSVTPFGKDGPEGGMPATDLTLEAAGGLLSLQGDAGRPPIPVGYPQASFHSGVQAAADAVVALHERLRSGRGQHLDVSMQAAMVWTLMSATGYPPNVHDDPPGYCAHRNDPPVQVLPGFVPARLWECADGFATYTTTLPVIGPRTHHDTLGWAESEGKLEPALRGIDWNNWIRDAVEGRLPVEAVVRSMAAVAAFLRTKTKAELQAFAVAHGSLLAPIYTVPDLLTDPQLEARQFWTECGGRLHPGPFAKLSGTPLRMDRPAPALGEAQRAFDAPAPRAAATAAGERRPAFEGLKVADFAWVGVGPIISKALADHGATVVHVESTTRPDVLRLLPPFKDGVPGIDRSQFMANFNTSKLGLALDLTTEGGLRTARRLVQWADVVVESFTPGTMAKFGLDYATLSKDRPELVMLSTCLRGQTGPERTYTGFGGQGSALSGLHSITGWPDLPPAGPWGAYTDFINPRFGVAALGAALMHRARTGEGQHVDISQVEGAIHFIEPLVLDYTVNGRAPAPASDSSVIASPHGVIATEGYERFIALAVETPEQWHALCGVAPLGPFTGPEFDSLQARRSASGPIHDALARWCGDQDAFVLGATLRRAGVPAYAVLRPTDLYHDPQLAHRGFFVTLAHGEMGPTPYDGFATRFSATPGQLRSAAPCLGQDTERVLREILGCDDDEIAGLAAEGALT